MFRDFDAVRRAIRPHDSVATETAWERRADQLIPVTGREFEEQGDDRTIFHSPDIRSICGR